MNRPPSNYVAEIEGVLAQWIPRTQAQPSVIERNAARSSDQSVDSIIAALYCETQHKT